ncbi:MAG: HAD hydrolase-like protein, partial [Anaerolineales bacterium]
MTLDKINSILFDLDGTILDSRIQDHELVTRLFRDLLKQNVKPELVATYFGMSSQKILEDVAPDRVKELMPLLADIQREISGLASVFPGVCPMIRKLSQAGFSWAVVTSKTQEELTISRKDYDLPNEIDVWDGADDA